METNKKIRMARRDAKMTQEELEKKCGMCHSHISAYERGLRIPTLSTISRIAKALNVSPMSLLPDSFLEADKKTK
jgi:transcriptional regulator with XRE-family HTH domain